MQGCFIFTGHGGGKAGLDSVLPMKEGQVLLHSSKILTFTVGLLMLGFAGVAHLLYFKDLSTTIYEKQIRYVGWFISSIFVLRAIGDFHTVGLFKKIRSTKFAEFDSKYFVPLTYQA